IGCRYFFLARNPRFPPKRRHGLSAALPELLSLHAGADTGRTISSESGTATDSADEFRSGGRAETGSFRRGALPTLHTVSQGAAFGGPYGRVFAWGLHPFSRLRLGGDRILRVQIGRPVVGGSRYRPFGRWTVGGLYVLRSRFARTKPRKQRDSMASG